MARPRKPAARSRRWIRKPGWNTIAVVLLAVAYVGVDTYLVRRATGWLFWGALAVLTSPAWLGLPIVLRGGASFPVEREEEEEDKRTQVSRTLTDPMYSMHLGNSWHDSSKSSRED